MSEGAVKTFRYYTKLPVRVPRSAWIALRAVVLAVTAALVLTLRFVPDLGITLFWGLFIPMLPAFFVAAPGLWQQVCPMAALNQIPRTAGLSFGRSLPQGLRDWAFAIAVIAFIGFVGLRVPWLNHNAFWLETTLIAMLALSLLGGIAFKGRSGWCGTFCPLAPIQRFYSHAPIIRVRNGEDPGHAGQRRFFMTTMPGVLCGYFLQGPSPSYGEPLHAVIFVMAALSSAGLYQAIISFSGLNQARLASLFVCLSLIIYYAFSGPVFVDTIGQIAGIHMPNGLANVSRSIGALFSLAVYSTATPVLPKGDEYMAAGAARTDNRYRVNFNIGD